MTALAIIHVSAVEQTQIVFESVLLTGAALSPTPLTVLHSIAIYVVFTAILVRAVVIVDLQFLCSSQAITRSFFAVAVTAIVPVAATSHLFASAYFLSFFAFLSLLLLLI